LVFGILAALFLTLITGNFVAETNFMLMGYSLEQNSKICMNTFANLQNDLWVPLSQEARQLTLILGPQENWATLF
jgi:hypothetical protein